MTKIAMTLLALTHVVVTLATLSPAMDVHVLVSSHLVQVAGHDISFADDNECLLGTARCVQNCHDTPGSYTCSCRAGYSLDPDGFSCNSEL